MQLDSLHINKYFEVHCSCKLISLPAVGRATEEIKKVEYAENCRGKETAAAYTDS